jgi:putative SbcD/Mre11-related phosphoesterase
MRFIYNAPAILHKGALIVGDTHFGMESKLRRRGIFDEQFSVRLFAKLRELVIGHKAKKLILLGDVKEDITTLDATTEQILAKLSLVCEVIIVKGNHDGGIERCGNARVVGPEGFVHEGLGLVHGHSWPKDELMECDYIVSGHQHPMIELTDAFGKARREAAWLIAPCDKYAMGKRYGSFDEKIKLILMPAFNPMVGSAIKYDDKERLGPILNNKLFKLDVALVYRLNGTRLGKLKELI